MKALPLLLALLGVGIHLAFAAGEADAGELVPIVVASGFLDGIHPCGLAVLLFLVAFLLSLKRNQASLLAHGGLYILGVFIAYFLIGVGILKVFSLFPGHFMGQLGAALLIILGIVNIKDGVFGGATLRIPKFAGGAVEGAIRKATLPASLVAGFLVGLCAFPCAGGIYVAILGLISAKMTFGAGLAYLFLYNVFFVMPLVIVLVLATRKKALEWLDNFEKKGRKRFKIAFGAAMVLLGLFILFGGIMG